MGHDPAPAPGPGDGFSRSCGDGGRSFGGSLESGFWCSRWKKLSSHGSELSGFGTVLDHLNWIWLIPAVFVEAASLVAFAGVQFRLLGAGGLAAPPAPLIGITFASQAITNTLPGGGAIAAVYGFRWYRRLGADDPLAAWAIVGAAVTAGLSLALVAAIGLVLATGLGASLDLIPVVAGVLTAALAAGILFVYERPLAWVVHRALRISVRLIGRPSGDLEDHIERVVKRVTVVRLHRRQIAAVLGWGMANWLFDCSCFAFSFLMVGAGIPWKGLLLAYGAGQLAANLPITPGGLGAVEGSITIALAYFGGAKSSTVDAVLVYRLISFWGVLIVGWAAWSWARSAFVAAAGRGTHSPRPRIPPSKRRPPRNWRWQSTSMTAIPAQLEPASPGPKPRAKAHKPWRNELDRTTWRWGHDRQWSAKGAATDAGRLGDGGRFGPERHGDRWLHGRSQRAGDRQQRVLRGAADGRVGRARRGEAQRGAAGSGEHAPSLHYTPLRSGPFGAGVAADPRVPGGVLRTLHGHERGQARGPVSGHARRGRSSPTPTIGSWPPWSSLGNPCRSATTRLAF